MKKLKVKQKQHDMRQQQRREYPLQGMNGRQEMNAEPFFRQVKQRLSQLLPAGTTYKLRCDLGIMVSTTDAQALSEQLQQFRAELQASTDKAMQAVYGAPLEG